MACVVNPSSLSSLLFDIRPQTSSGMTRQQDDAECKARAVEGVARKTKPARVIAHELGVPRKTL
jgi:hypothetical protein